MSKILIVQIVLLFIQTMTHFPDARQTLRSLVSFHVKCDEHTPGMSTGSANRSTHLCTNGSFSGKSSGK